MDPLTQHPRVRAVGELLENQFRIGLERMERAIKEKMSIQQDMFTTMPRDLVNAKPVTADFVVSGFDQLAGLVGNTCGWKVNDSVPTRTARR